MKPRSVVANLFPALVAVTLPHSTAASQADHTRAQESRVPVGDVSLYARAVGDGPPVLVLHGGPDFDHAYLVPHLDELGDRFRLIYYDQRGRGRSAEDVRPDDVTLRSDVDDIERIRRYFGVETPIILGHSWGAVLALEYALRYSTNVSHLIIMNPAPASTSDAAVMRAYYLDKLGADMDRQREIVASDGYHSGDPAAVTARYRIHFRPALRRAEDYEALMSAMRTAFFRQGSAGILKARAVEDRLMADTWALPDYDLIPKLRALSVPALVIAGDHDFIPVEVAEHIASALPDAELVVLEDCGHFSYLECAPQLHNAFNAFFGRAR